MTIIQQDIYELSDAIKSVTGFGLEAIKEDGRVKSYVMPTKVALCYYMDKMKYSIQQMSNALNCTRGVIYHCLRCHHDMMYSDENYRRCIEAIDNSMIRVLAETNWNMILLCVYVPHNKTFYSQIEDIDYTVSQIKRWRPIETI